MTDAIVADGGEDGEDDGHDEEKRGDGEGRRQNGQPNYSDPPMQFSHALTRRFLSQCVVSLFCSSVPRHALIADSLDGDEGENDDDASDIHRSWAAARPLSTERAPSAKKDPGDSVSNLDLVRYILLTGNQSGLANRDGVRVARLWLRRRFFWDLPQASGRFRAVCSVKLLSCARAECLMCLSSQQPW